MMVLAKPALRQAQCSLVHLYEVGVNILDLVLDKNILNKAS